MTRAAVETVAENASDGVVAPLFYIMLGGAPLGCLYKAANTMDSMVGYKNERYLDFGRFAAKLDDVLNFIPSRLCALFDAWRGAAMPYGRKKRPAHLETGPVQARKPQLRADRGRDVGGSSRPAGRKRILLRQAA